MSLLLSALLTVAFAQDPEAPAPGDAPLADERAPTAPGAGTEVAPPEEPVRWGEEVPSDVSAARQCAESAVGTEIEVCLGLAARYPGEIDGITASLRAHVDRGSETDRELLAALLLLLADETGVDGVRRLGDLGDPRAVRPLAHAGENRELSVALAATDALANYPEGLDPLTRWIVDRSMPLDVRVQAAYAIGRTGSDEGADTLVSTLRSSGVPAPLRRAMLETIETHFPSRMDELGRQVSQDGTVWLAGAGAWGLGYGLGFAGFLGRGNLEVLGGSTGFIAGGTAGWVAGRAWPMEASDASFLTTSGVIGGIGGTLIGGGVSWDAEGAWIGGLAGNVAGFSLGAAFRKAHPGTVTDSVEAAFVSGAVALAAGTGVGYATSGWRNNWGDRRTDMPVLAAGIGFIGGVAVGHLVAPSIDVTRDDAFMITLATSYGLTVGSLAPVSEFRGGLPFTGLAVGGLVGYGLAGFVEPDFDVIIGGYTGLAFGGAIGAGVGLLADPFFDSNGNAMRGSSLALGTVGMGLGLWASHRNPEPIDNNDVVLTGLVTGFASWQSIGWYSYLFPPPQTDGLFLLLPPALGAATAMASPILDVPVAYSFSALSMGMWGAYLGGVSGELLGAPGDDVLLYTLVGSDLGLAAGIVLAAPPLSMPPLVIGLADAGGVLGGSTFALGANFFSRDVHTILGASLAGSAIGFVGGALLGGVLHRRGTTRDVAFLPLPHLSGRLPGKWVVAPAAFPGEESMHYGASIQVSEW